MGIRSRRAALLVTGSLVTGFAWPVAAQSVPAGDAPVSTPAAAKPGDKTGQKSSETTTAQASGSQGDGNDIVVTGVRASLLGAQNIKRNSVQVVDSIVAEDIGKLPDNTVSDALQRVTGIQVSRANGEVSTVLVRGLPDIETLLNGRETFTGTGRGVALQDIPAELVAGIDVYKTNLPEQIEGSVSGTIDIRLRRPFDFDGLQVAGSARGIYSDQRKKGSYIASGLVSDRWTTGAGEFGVLIAASYNHRLYEDQTAFNFGFNPLSGTDPTRIPDTVGGLITDGNRSRPSLNVSLQWKPTPNLEFYADGVYTGYRQDYDVDFFVGLPKAGGVTVDSIQDGSATNSETGGPVAHTITTVNNFTITSKQTFHQVTDGYQGNIGTKFTTGNTVLTGEVTYNKSQVTSRQYVVDTAFVVPRIDYNFDAGRTPNVNFNGFPIADPTHLNFFTLFDNRNIANSEQYAVHADLLHSFDSGFLKNFKIGVRYADRTGNSAGTPTGGYPLGFTATAPYANFSTNAPADIIDNRVGIDSFALTSSQFIRNNIATLRTLAGRPTGDPVFDPAQSFSLDETVYAAYGQAAFGFDAGSVPVDGTIGIRAVNTVTNLDAVEVLTANGTRQLLPITGRRNTLDLLPSLSLKVHPTDQIVLRAVVGKAVLRPQFAQLNPAVSTVQTGATGNQGFIGTQTGGNPNLREVKSTNVDVSAEWYFARTGSLTVAGFYKKLDGYIQTYSSSVPGFTAAGVPGNYLFTGPQNTNNGELKGLEASYTQFYDFLPGALSGFGLQASFTLSDGKVDDPIHPGHRQDITPVSRYSYNLVGIYEKYGFSARLAYNWRSKYIDSYSDAFAGGKVVVSPVAFLDLSASYAINDKITLTVDATNLLGETYHDQFGTSGLEPRDTRQYDRTFGGGVRFKF